MENKKPSDVTTLEEAFGELNLIIDKMDDHDITLDDSFRLYQDGMNLLKFCNNAIERVEKELIILEENISETM